MGVVFVEVVPSREDWFVMEGMSSSSSVKSITPDRLSLGDDAIFRTMCLTLRVGA